MRAGKLALALSIALFPPLAAPALASSPVLLDQSAVNLTSSLDVSNHLAAEDLDLPVQTRLDTFTVWLTEDISSDNGALENFNGKLSWALYSGNFGPQTLLFSGTDFAIEFVDTGLQTVGDVIRAVVDLDGRPIVGPGKVWIVLHEGVWGSVGDNTVIRWLASDTSAGLSVNVSDAETNPTPETWTSGSTDVAMTVEGEAVFWNQGQANLVDAYDISAAVEANDFVLDVPTRIASADAWLSDGAAGNNKLLDNFDGTLSWAIYNNSSGLPSGSPIASGDDATPIVDYFGETVGGKDVLRVRIELAGQPSLAAGTYWLALHEGVWGSVYDNSAVYWLKSAAVIGSNAAGSINETSPGGWFTIGNDLDLAFVLFEDELFSSGFEAGEICAWSGATAGALCN